MHEALFHLVIPLLALHTHIANLNVHPFFFEDFMKIIVIDIVTIALDVR